MTETVTVEPKPRTQKVTPPQASLLWRAFSLKGCDDDTEKKGAIATEFKSRMSPGVIWVEQPNGDFRQKKDPRGTKAFRDTDDDGKAMFLGLAFTTEQVGYIAECVTELKKAKNNDGTPMVDASVSDEFHYIESVLIPKWREAAIPDEPPTAIDAPEEAPALAAPAEVKS